MLSSTKKGKPFACFLPIFKFFLNAMDVYICCIMLHYSFEDDIRTLNTIPNTVDCVNNTSLESSSSLSINPNKSGLFEGSLFWGESICPHPPPQLPLDISRRTYLLSIQQLLNNLFRVC